MHKRSLIYLALSCLLIHGSCSRKETISPPATPWSSGDPLSIPLRQRQVQYLRGNLVKNPSFESGRYYNIDTLLRSFNLAGWSKVGENVEWVNLDYDTLFSEDEVFHGLRAIRIKRDIAYETTKQGEGIMSDFIRVIPGNYDLTYHVRLSDIKSPKQRLGTKIFDAIDVRLLFYDKNKLPISGDILNPCDNKYLDNSFKGYSFSNYWQIPEFNWAKVHGRTYNYPFSEGDIPDDAKFVKIFLGLKGSGTMWVDAVDFRMTRWNFTAWERMAHFNDTLYSPQDLLVPKPKQVSRLDSMSLLDPQMNPPVVVIPVNPDKTTLHGANILKEKLDQVIKAHTDSAAYPRDIEIRTNIADAQILDGQLVFALGRNSLWERWGDSLDLLASVKEEQGYVIAPHPDQNNLIYLLGNRSIGDFYAATTALQLIDDSTLIFHNARITDWPDFAIRGVKTTRWTKYEALPDRVNALELLSLNKLNKVYLEHPPETETDQEWFEPDAKFYRNMGKWAAELLSSKTMDLGLMIQPYSHLDSSRCIDSLRAHEKQAWSHSSYSSLATLRNLIRRALNSGIKTITICTHDFLPHLADLPQAFVLFDKKDEGLFHSVADAHISMIDNLFNWMQNITPSSELEFVPPWHHNEHIDNSMGFAEQYFRELQPNLPDEVRVLWSGPTSRSLSVDRADHKRYEELIGNDPVLWDHSLYARSLDQPYGGYPALYPGKTKMCNLAEPYDVVLPDSFFLMNKERQIIFDPFDGSELANIKFATAADYAWNATEYDPDFSLWKVLLLRYGQHSAREILLFNQAYFGLVSIMAYMERDGLNNKLVKQGQDLILFMEDHLMALNGLLGSEHSLFIELEQKGQALRSEFEEQMKKLKEQDSGKDSTKPR